MPDRLRRTGLSCSTSVGAGTRAHAQQKLASAAGGVRAASGLPLLQLPHDGGAHDTRRQALGEDGGAGVMVAVLQSLGSML